MKLDERERAKHALAEIRRRLDHEPLALDQREELERHAAALSGALLSTWLPVGWGRRALMIGIIILGFEESIRGNLQPLVWWLLLPVFSPRLMGEAAYFVGRLLGPSR